MKEGILMIFDILSDLGYLGIALGLMIEVIPSEIVLSYGGFLISSGDITFVGAVIAGTIGGTLAQLFLYWAGYFGGRPFLLKYGKYILITEKQISLSEKWFQRFGPGVIFTARFIPVVRHAISIPAGIAKMSHLKFTLYTVVAVIPWTIFFLYLGQKLGNNWEHIDEYAAPYIRHIIFAAVTATIIYFSYMLLKRKESN